ncbi:hypothetical protein NDU88_000336 [Pleurodeles waltl]|uniref:Uncharacterized protein n=1 Tax=Pleurodeles waltl TaxID=8319 RepID=A0AAV7KMN9_PLEWA|nr:hypothetical protein NDU88_000336 [Pleurodeles waltl]
MLVDIFIYRKPSWRSKGHWFLRFTIAVGTIGTTAANHSVTSGNLSTAAAGLFQVATLLSQLAPLSYLARLSLQLALFWWHLSASWMQQSPLSLTLAPLDTSLRKEAKEPVVTQREWTSLSLK